ncbi:MAG: M14 family metallopeptidase [Acutalibacteraceae bacterium]|nr:M14 family metallopeptidase [Acutalibacteraceae bacterium]
MKNKKCKKGLIIFTAVILAVGLFLTAVGPQLVLTGARQPEVEEGYAYSEVFYNSYDEIRAHLEDRIEQLRKKDITVEVSEYAVDESDNLYIDNIYLPANKENKNLIVLTTGVHGMEGYIGSVMLDVFFDEIYPTLDTDSTGLLIVANVNPYGMKYMRRYNENNVDLNRNFIIDWDNFDLTSNKDYPEVKQFLQPEGKIGNALWHEVGFYLSLAKEAITKGADKVSDALLTGQYEYPTGVYYGGKGDEKSTAYLKGVFDDCLEGDYENIVHIDIHSGYGPRYNMVIFNSVYETMTEAETKKAFGYDYVISHDSESFYATTGDTTDFFYRLAEKKNTEKDLFSTCFEFGTIGDSFMDSILSLKYTVDENRQHWYPSENKVSSEVVRENYYELFYPTETQWREKTVADFKTATQGVLTAKLK